MASAIIEADRFNARNAVMVIHSFNQEDLWFDEFRAFLALYGVQAAPHQLYFLKEIRGVNLYAGWARGDSKYLLA